MSQVGKSPLRHQGNVQGRGTFGLLVRLALDAAGDHRLSVLACLADEWQQVVDQGLGGYDPTAVTKALEQQGTEPKPGGAAT